MGGEFDGRAAFWSLEVQQLGTSFDISRKQTAERDASRRVDICGTICVVIGASGGSYQATGAARQGGTKYQSGVNGGCEVPVL